MAGPLGSPAAQFSGPPYMHPFRPASSMSANNRFDEGYSEDTRSQSGSDMVMRSDSQLAGDGMQPDSPFALPDWVMALSEGERSGTSHCVEILGSVLTGH
jgi:F-box and WD-40 domain protein 1/11